MIEARIVWCLRLTGGYILSSRTASQAWRDPVNNNNNNNNKSKCTLDHKDPEATSQRSARRNCVKNRY